VGVDPDRQTIYKVEMRVRLIERDERERETPRQRKEKDKKMKC
jgi:hypothetical protein